MAGFRDGVMKVVSSADSEAVARSREQAEAEARAASLGIEAMEVLREFGVETVAFWHQVKTGETHVPEGWHEHGRYRQRTFVPAHTVPTFAYDIAGRGWVLYRDFMTDGSRYEVGNLCLMEDGRLFTSRGAIAGIPGTSGEPLPDGSLSPDRFVDSMHEKSYAYYRNRLEQAVAHRLNTGAVLERG